MGFGFRVGVPGMRVRVSTRGVRASIGPRAARISVGSGGARVSSGLGPFFASSSLRGGRGRSRTTRRTAPRTRAVPPSAAQLARARVQAERAREQAQRDAAIRQLSELRRQMTSVHLQVFPTARRPEVPAPPVLGLAWAQDEARAFHLRGVGLLARAERAAAKSRALADAPGYLAAEQERLRTVGEQLTAEAGAWWQALLGNDEETVCEAVNAAFSDNPAASCAVGVQDGVMSVLMRQHDLDTLPDQAPALTPSGRPTLKALTKRDRMLWWLTAMGSNVVATLKEGFACAPGIHAIDLAVLTRLPDTQRLGFVAFGRWTRTAVERTAWRAPEDALRFLDIGQDVVCAVSTTAAGNLSTSLRPLDIGRVAGLRELLDQMHEENDDVTVGGHEPVIHPGAVRDEQALEPYRVRPFADWYAEARPGQTAPVPSLTPNADGPPMALAPGQTVVLPEEAYEGLSLAFVFAGADADLTLLLTGADGRVAGDHDFVFYHQPVGAGGAARLLGKQWEGPYLTERAAVHLPALPAEVRRVVVSVSMDVDTGLTCGALTHSRLSATSTTGPAWTFDIRPDPAIKAMVVAEIYRHTVAGTEVWKLRALGQGWADGLDGLARAYGVAVDG